MPCDTMLNPKIARIRYTLKPIFFFIIYGSVVPSSELF